MGGGKLDRLPALAAELVGLNVDIIVLPGGNSATRAAKQATTTIPIVMTHGQRSRCSWVLSQASRDLAEMSLD